MLLFGFFILFPFLMMIVADDGTRTRANGRSPEFAANARLMLRQSVGIEALVRSAAKKRGGAHQDEECFS
jgi:hypothetical protein